VESNLGFLEYEMCTLFQTTPKGLGELRDKDPLGLMFIEKTFVYRKQKEYEEYKKREQEAKRKSRSKRPRG
jgi:hypothetical protein